MGSKTPREALPAIPGITRQPRHDQGLVWEAGGKSSYLTRLFNTASFPNDMIAYKML